MEEISNQNKALILLQDGTIFFGKALGVKGTAYGELCFNTGMTGYQEIFTDPSYYGQLMVTTNSHIGNYGVNEEEVSKLVHYFRGTGIVVRFIEYMDVGRTNGWQLGQVVPSENVLNHLQKEFDLVPVEPTNNSDVAVRWAHSDGSGEIGFISSVTSPFCGDCVRARLSADGRLVTCLFASGGHDIRALIHNGADEEILQKAIAAIWTRRKDRYSEIRSEDTAALPRIEMSYIGG